ncbi:hypothetical protein QQP08_014869 [Theobroma cacao]|nr:hypothetical protein QQP08_014869 [Theobroma cacao]
MLQVSSLATTTEAIVTEPSKDEKEAPAAPGGMAGLDCLAFHNSLVGAMVMLYSKFVEANFLYDETRLRLERGWHSSLGPFLSPLLIE